MMFTINSFDNQYTYRFIYDNQQFWLLLFFRNLVLHMNDWKYYFL